MTTTTDATQKEKKLKSVKLTKRNRVPSKNAVYEESKPRTSLHEPLHGHSTREHRMRMSEKPDCHQDAQEDTILRVNPSTHQSEQKKKTKTKDQTLTFYKSRLTRLSAELSQCKSQLVSTETEVKRLRKIRDERGYLDSDELELTDSFVIGQLKRERDDLARLVILLRQRSDSLQQHNAQLLSQVANSIEIAATIKEEKMQVDVQLEGLQLELTTVRSKLDHAFKTRLEETVGHMKATTEDAHSDVDQLKKLLVEANEKRARAESTADQLRIRLTEMKAELDRSERKLQNFGEKQLLNHKDETTREDKNRHERNSVAVEVAELQGRLIEQQTAHEQRNQLLTRQLEEAKRNFIDLEEQLTNVLEERTRFSTKAQEFQHEASMTRNQLQKLSHEHNTELHQITSAAASREHELLRQLKDMGDSHGHQMAVTTRLMEQYRMLIAKFQDLCVNGMDQFDQNVNNLTLKQASLNEASQKNRRVIKRMLRQTMSHPSYEDGADHQSRLSKMGHELKNKSDKITILESQQNQLLDERNVLTNELHLMRASCQSNAMTEWLAEQLHENVHVAENLDHMERLTNSQNDN